MRYFLLILATILTCRLGFSQEFAPVGAEWHYEERFAFSGERNYQKFTSEKDTVIQGEICKKITKRKKMECNDRPLEEYIFTRNDTVFFFDTIFNEFQILYDFSAQKNSSWIIKMKDWSLENTIDSFYVAVDSITYININNQDLKTLNVTYSMPNKEIVYGGTIIEKIGDPRYMIYWEASYYDVCDANYVSGLRCYYDDEFGLYSTGLADSCTYTKKWTNIESATLENSIRVYPNPNSGIITLENLNHKVMDIELYDTSGRLMLVRRNFSFEEIDLSDYPSGIYILHSKSKNQPLESIKIIKR